MVNSNLSQVAGATHTPVVVITIPTPGVLCDQCKEGQFGFSSGGGCRECYCSEGSTSVQCDQYGQCPCAPGVGGLRCDR